MSTKTLRKRIALVAVSALTAGLFSVVSTPVANAADGDAIATGNVVLVETVGIKVGECLTQSEAATKVSTTPRVFQVGGTIRITATTNGTGVYNITGPAVFFATGNVANTISADQKTLTLASATTATTDVRFTGTGSVSIAIRATAGATPVHTYYFSVVSACSVGTYSATDSFVSVQTDGAAGAVSNNVDAATAVTAGSPLYVQVISKNAYGAALTAGTFVATATNGATVRWGATGAALVAGTLTVATVTSPDGTDQLRVDPASSLTTSTTTVTITHDGAPVATKTLTFYGEAKSIVIESVKSGRTGTSIAGNDATAYAVYSYRDSAGGKVPGSAAGFAAASATAIVTTGSSVQSPARSTPAANIAGALDNAVETNIGRIQDGVFGFTCGSTSGTSDVVIAHVNAISLATITAPVKVTCAGGIATYTVSTDKASYAVGEVATITIDAKDSSGNAVSDNTVITAGSVSVGGGALTATIAGTEVFTAGKRTLQAQMTTAGKFNTVVALAGSVTTTATTGYAVTDGAVSNAEVLKSIVALIASINKQIAALQKLILRR